MNFITLQYAVFLTMALAIYWRLQNKHQIIFLWLASYFFYACWDWQFLLLILTVSTVDFIAGHKIWAAKAAQNQFKSRCWLAFTLVINLSILGYFKYANFFVGSFISLLTNMGVNTHFGSLSIILPVGISFFVFQSISHSIDIYRDDLKPSRSYIEFLTFVSFFPQLVAGPIVRAKEFLYQLAAPRVFSWKLVEDGLHRIITGVIKKAVIADTLAIQLVDPVFADPSQYSTSMLWIAIIAYSIQIYCDFSGYSNIAIGSAKLFGFNLPENFKFPYLSRNFSEFWERWHLTMSRFFRDYVYIPLGGNRRSPGRNTGNLVTTTLVSGLWHGAAWNFVFWGALHGVLLIIQRAIPRWIKNNSPVVVSVLCVYFLTLMTWIFFRAQNIDAAIGYLDGLFNYHAGAQIGISTAAIVCGILFCIDHLYGLYQNQLNTLLQIPLVKAAFWVTCLLIIFHFKPSAPSPFIYFQF